MLRPIYSADVVDVLDWLGYNNIITLVRTVDSQ